MAITFQGMVSTFRIVGTGATPHNLFTIENQNGSGVSVYIRRLVIMMDKTGALATPSPLYRTSRPILMPTGGTALNKGNMDTALTSSAQVVCRSATASDGGGASAITATFGDVLWETYGMRVHTQAGQVLGLEALLIPTETLTYPVKLLNNQALLVQVLAPYAAANPSTDHFVVNCYWTEET